VGWRTGREERKKPPTKSAEKGNEDNRKIGKLQHRLRSGFIQTTNVIIYAACPHSYHALMQKEVPVTDGLTRIGIRRFTHSHQIRGDSNRLHQPPAFF